MYYSVNEAGILGKRKSESCYQETNLRSSLWITENVILLFFIFSFLVCSSNFSTSFVHLKMNQGQPKVYYNSLQDKSANDILTAS